MAGTLTTREPRGLRSWFEREPLATLRDEMNDLLGRFLEEGQGGWGAGRIAPSLDLSETDTEVRARVDVPGMKPDDIDIQISGNTLTVSGERKEEKEEKGRSYHRIERRFGSFSRSVTLPCEVNEEKADAKYQDGVLTIVMQKTEAAKSHKVKVKA